MSAAFILLLSIHQRTQLCVHISCTWNVYTSGAPCIKIRYVSRVWTRCSVTRVYTELYFSPSLLHFPNGCHVIVTPLNQNPSNADCGHCTQSKTILVCTNWPLDYVTIHKSFANSPTGSVLTCFLCVFKQDKLRQRLARALIRSLPMPLTEWKPPFLHENAKISCSK